MVIRSNMKSSLFFLITMIIGCTNVPKDQTTKVNAQYTGDGFSSEDSLVVVTTVQEFFKAFDERNTDKMNNILSPDMKIIHHNGTTTNREEMMTVIKETKNWWPRTRKLSGFECSGDDNLAVVGLYNEVIFSLPENRTVVEPYKETWIFRKTGNQWKPVRCHYSKVIADKHSEEVE